MTLSLAFLSPVLAEAAMEGRLPRGFCIKRLTDLPMLWSEQWRAIGLQAPAQVRVRTRLIHPASFRAQRILLVVIGRLSASAPPSPSRGPGNGILRAETGGRFQAQNAGERPEFNLQTATPLTNRPELRGFLPTRKPRRFAGTAWWAMQGSNLRPLPCEGSARAKAGRRSRGQFLDSGQAKRNRTAALQLLFGFRRQVPSDGAPRVGARNGGVK